MDTIDEKEFLKRNNIVANNRVSEVLFFAIMAGPLIALGGILKVFETGYLFCFLITCIALLSSCIDWLLCKNEKHYKIAKYYGLISIAVLIGIMATEFTVGIYISYILIPLLSCMYLDTKLTRNVCMMSYVIMIIALYFRSFGAVERAYTYLTQMEWFISQSMGYTIEFCFASIVLYFLTVYLRSIMKSYYQEIIEKINSSQTDRVKSTFFKNMTAELKEILDQVDTLSEELLADSNMDDNERKKVRIIANTNRMMRSKMKDMSDFTRIDLTKKQATIRKYRLTSLVREIKQAVQSRLGDKQIDFNVLVNPSVPNELIGDKVRIRQVIINLLNNSIESQEEGFIVIKIDWKKKDEMAVLLIDVMDNSYDNRVEEAQVMDSTFSICKDLCEYMNGSIEISSDYDKGSGFTITLPQMIANEYAAYGDL